MSAEEDATAAELTADQRRRNVQRVREAEARLSQVEQQALALVFQGASVMRRVHEARQLIREAFGEDRLPDLPPLAEAAETLAGEVVIIEAGRPGERRSS